MTDVNILTAGANPAQGYYSSSVVTLADALNEAKATADLAVKASATQGGIYFVEKNGSAPTVSDLTAYDLVMQEI